MNLANVINFDPDRYTYTIEYERAHQPNGTAPPAPSVTRVHLEEREDRVILCGKARRSLRAGGTAVIAALDRIGRIVNLETLHAAMPEVGAGTLRCRLSCMTQRGDVARYGEKYGYKYGIPGGSTSEST